MTAPQADPILAWLDEHAITAELSAPVVVTDVAKVYAALRREVEAHPAMSGWRPHWPYSVDYCRACDRPVPCPTRQRIAESLGVTLPTDEPLA